MDTQTSLLPIVFNFTKRREIYENKDSGPNIQYQTDSCGYINRLVAPG